MLGSFLAATILLAPQPVLRGAMVSTDVTKDDLIVLGREWKANVIRYQLTWSGFPKSKADDASPEEHFEWLQATLKKVDENLPTCRLVGLKVVLDLHTGPGGRDAENGIRILQEARFADAFVGEWEHMARRYRGNRTIWAFDLLNEPTVTNKDVTTWPELALRAAKAIRAIDPGRTLIYEPSPWADSAGFKDLKPLPLDDVVYSPHFYNPFQFTHQGVYQDPVGVEYPGRVAGERWDKARLAKVLEPVEAFQKQYKVPIYVGEFSVIRWAPGNSGLRYLSDLTDLFEVRGWSWTYHAFREWDGWSVEHGSTKGDNAPVPTTPRKSLLLKLFAKNAK
ncbi:MAG TPA: cellulase family glycosylhydrolase [Fimbriimonas sp.]